MFQNGFEWKLQNSTTSTLFSWFSSQRLLPVTKSKKKIVSARKKKTASVTYYPYIFWWKHIYVRNVLQTLNVWVTQYWEFPQNTYCSSVCMYVCVVKLRTSNYNRRVLCKSTVHAWINVIAFSVYMILTLKNVYLPITYSFLFFLFFQFFCVCLLPLTQNKV